MPILPALLTVHVAFAVGLFLPSVLLPFTLRGRRPVEESTSPAVRGLLWLQGSGTVAIGAGLAATGLAMLGILGAQLARQPWLLVALGIYGLNLGLAYFVQRPNLRRLLRLPNATDQEAWRDRARRQRYVSYLMAGLVGLIAFLMSTKPALW